MLFLNQAFMMLWEAILENATLVSALLLILLAAWIYWAVAGRHKNWHMVLLAYWRVPLQWSDFYLTAIF